MELDFEAILTTLRQSSLYRKLPNSDESSLYQFHSNDYLNLARHDDLAKMAALAINEHGFGSTGSRLLSGNYALLESLEHSLADFLGMEQVLVFNSGFQLNAGVIPTLYGEGDLILADKYCHASLLDGMQLSQATMKRFKHNDMNHLKLLLENHRCHFKRCLLVTESLFSMDGDIAPLDTLQQFTDDYDVDFMVDEAHAIGVLGDQGRGLCSQFGIKPTYLVGTFGKAFGTFGAFIATSRDICDYLVNRCRAFIYTTALPVPVIAATKQALVLIQSMDSQRKQLRDLSAYFMQVMSEKGYGLLGEYHILSLLWPGNESLLERYRALQEVGVNVSAVRYPTVSKGKERFRFSLKSSHTKADIDYVVNQF